MHERKQTSFCPSQDTREDVKNKHFATDILKKSKLHTCCFRGRKSIQKNVSKTSLAALSDASEHIPGGSDWPPNREQLSDNQKHTGPPMPYRGHLQVWAKSACSVIYIYIYIYYIYNRANHWGGLAVPQTVLLPWECRRPC